MPIFWLHWNAIDDRHFNTYVSLTRLNEMIPDWSKLVGVDSIVLNGWRLGVWYLQSPSRVRSKTVAVYLSSIGNHENLVSPYRSWMNPTSANWCDYQGKPTLVMAACSIWLLIKNRTEFSLVILWDHEIVKPIWWTSLLLLLNHDWTLDYLMISEIEVQCWS